MLDLKQKEYVDWNVRSVIKIAGRENYGFRVVLTHPDGTKTTRQHSGYATKKEAGKERDLTLGELASGTYIINRNVKLEDFFEYWLEYDIRQRVASSNTYNNFSNIARKHVAPILGKKYLTQINKGDMMRLYKNRAQVSQNIARQTKVVMNVAMKYAIQCKLLMINPAEGVPLPKGIKKQAYHTRNIDTKKTLNMEQITRLLDASKDTPIHMQVLFNVLMGLRRQEINGLKYSDVDYINRTLTVERQLGTGLNRDPYGKSEKPLTRQELPLKTQSSYRKLPIPDRVFEAILEERGEYERNRSRRSTVFQDDDYICCSSYGRPRSKDFHWAHYKKLLAEQDLPDIRWHDLRSTYCTLLLKNEFAPKAVSKLMGHAKEIITMDVYGDNSNIIPEEIPELLAYMEDVMPKKQDADREEILDPMIDFSCLF